MLMKMLAGELRSEIEERDVHGQDFFKFYLFRKCLPVNSEGRELEVGCIGESGFGLIVGW